MNVKIKYFFLGITSLMLLYNTKAQEKTEIIRNNNIKFNPLSALIKVANLSFEHKTKTQQSFQLNAMFLIDFDMSNLAGVDNTNTSESDNHSGIVITPEYRFYMQNSDELKGAYLSPYYRLLTYKISRNNTSNDISVIGHGLGVLAGYQILFGNRAVFDFNLGIGKSTNFIDYEIKSEHVIKTNFRLGLNLGITF